MAKTKTARKRRSYEYDHHYGLSSQVGTAKKSRAKPVRAKRSAKKR
jgi:hypothetical protein